MRVVTLCTGDKYGREYVDRLYYGLARHTTKPFEFECIRESEYPGWWGKLEIFPPKERTVFLDLDTVITGNVDFLFEYDGPFCILRDFYHRQQFGSAIMSIAPGFGGSIIESFVADAPRIMRRLHGDQDWIFEQVKTADHWQDLYPGKIKSFKAHDLLSGPAGASVVCFHGQPKPHECNGWVKEHWR